MNVVLRKARFVQMLLFFVLVTSLTSCASSHQFSGSVLENPVPAYAFEGTNYTGDPFRLSDHHGKVVVIFFGYTLCPDICPLTLANLKQVADKLGDKAQDLAVVFITVDPERDTVERLATYVQAFSPDFYGVRMEGQMYEATKKAYGVFAEKSKVDTGNPDSYFVDHTGGIYIIDRNGDWRELFRHDATVEMLLPDIDYWLEQ